MVKNLNINLLYLNTHSDFKQSNKIRSHFLSIISKFQNRVLSNNSTFEKQLKIDIKLTKTFIKNSKDLLITKADKGNATVIIKKSAYYEKMTMLFNDEKYYEKIKKNPFATLERKTRLYINKLNEMNFLMNDTIISRVAQKCNVSKGYSLIKIHKVNNPVRPIISATNSPTYNLSKILSKFLYEHLKKPFSHIKNSLELKEKLEGIIIPDGFEIIILDVVSLSTNVPEYLICSAIEKRWTQLYIIHIYHPANS